ncbi:general stress protein CTC [Clostridium acetireducens DSM 10703]|uniref:Large ribosomal subunit protein bL25 n=1 Tax=Clostridium acetireducens DSM 10703 TaxID=1121290 RepID=A0A1E8EXU9_9CLOT|nr:50S ribosomal protein L25 [Clostridium acetireducens]OFI05779.1 general stress protein CTC [Clostridium acetireducens DSM 10703]
MENLVCNERKQSGKKVRKNGNIPGVIYGKNMNNLLFEISEMELNREIKKNGEHGIVNINLNNKNYKTIIKEVQRHPITHEIIHLDLENLHGNDKVQLEIPLVFNGEENIIKKGAVVQKEKDNILVKCSGNKIPNAFFVDVSNLKVGDAYRISDIEASKDIFFMEDIDTLIASIVQGNYKKDTEDEEESEDIED